MVSAPAWGRSSILLHCSPMLYQLCHGSWCLFGPIVNYLFTQIKRRVVVTLLRAISTLTIIWLSQKGGRAGVEIFQLIDVSYCWKRVKLKQKIKTRRIQIKNMFKGKTFTRAASTSLMIYICLPSTYLLRIKGRELWNAMGAAPARHGRILSSQAPSVSSQVVWLSAGTIALTLTAPGSSECEQISRPR